MYKLHSISLFFFSAWHLNTHSLNFIFDRFRVQALHYRRSDSERRLNETLSTAIQVTVITAVLETFFL
jgi:hypothetical protein